MQERVARSTGGVMAGSLPGSGRSLWVVGEWAWTADSAQHAIALVCHQWIANDSQSGPSILVAILP